MLGKILPVAAAAVLLTAPMTTPANAGKCWYAAVNPFSQKVSNDITGIGRGVWLSNACERAKSKCLRKLRKAWNKGKAQQFACVKRRESIVESKV
jgi:hypothetical protein